MKLKPKRPEMDISPDSLKAIKKMVSERYETIAQKAQVEMLHVRKAAEAQLSYHHKLLSEIRQEFADMAARFASWEESLLQVYHNIKKNQFLYSHYPDEWVQKYSDIKQGLRDDNEPLDEKIIDKAQGKTKNA